MENKTLSISQALSCAARLFFDRILFFLGAAITMCGTIIVPILVYVSATAFLIHAHLVQSNSSLGAFFASASWQNFPYMYRVYTHAVPFSINLLFVGLFIGFLIIAQGIFLGLIRIMLDAYEGKAVRYGQLFSQFDKLFRGFIVGVLFAFMVGIGFILFIIPGIYLMSRYAFAMFVLVDENRSIRESFSRSAELTRGHRWQIAGLYAAILLLQWGLGSFIGYVGFPFILLAYISAYKQLKA